MIFLLTAGIIGGALLIMSLALIITGENKVHTSCSASHELDGEGSSCFFCPNDEDEDQLTALAKAGYPGRKDIVSQEVYQGRPDRNIIVERLKYNSGRE